jgi:hypothetical protein
MADERQTNQQGSASGSVKGAAEAPYEGVVGQVVARIRNEPLLFLIAIAALIAGLSVAASGLGSPNLRFVIVVIAVLAFAGIGVYYLVASGSQKLIPGGGRITGSVRVRDLEGDAQIRGVKGPSGLATGSRVRGQVDVGRASGSARATGVELGDNDSDDPQGHRS